MVHMHALVGCLFTTLSVISVNATPAPWYDSRHGRGIDNYYSAQDVVKELNLTSNPEGGYFVQTFEDDLIVLGNRSASTAIYYLLEGSTGQSRWHSVANNEIWHYYAGAPLDLYLSWNNGTGISVQTLGPSIFHGQRPQIVVGKKQFQSAKSLGKWTLVGTTVAPGFDNSIYDLPPAGFVPT